MSSTIFQRTAMLLGESALNKLSAKHVILFGVGGVGSWCAESLVRSGICHLTIVDSDNVAESNINRQLVATHSAIGKPKVEILRQRLLDINPEADIVALNQRYTPQTASEFHLENYDYIIDAIDSLQDKAHLILQATSLPSYFFSSMGAALKFDPTRISVTEFWKVKGCPLAAALRRRFRHSKQFPQRKFKCVFSDELLSNKYQAEDEPRVNGTIAHITAIFGFTLASLVISQIVNS